MPAKSNKVASRRSPRVRQAKAALGRTFAKNPTVTELTQLYDFAPALFVLLDLSGLIVEINLTGARMLHTPRAQAIGLPFRMWVAVEDRRLFLEHLRRCRAGGDAVETDLRLRASDGGVMAVALHSRLSTFAGDQLFPTIAVDLTEYRSLEAARQVAVRQRARAERERDIARASESAKEELIAMVSHELRNPLSPALAAADALSGWTMLPDRARQLAEIIKRNIEMEARLVNDLLDIARVTRGQLSLHRAPVDVHQILLDAINACTQACQARGVTISLDLQAWMHHTDGDDARLRQVFWNVIMNAIRFSEPGGVIMVRTSSDADNIVRVLIRDHGAGMDAGTVEQLFHPFQRNRETVAQGGGLGLGLTISRGIVEAHGGRISAASAGPGFGSTFEVALTACKPPCGDETSAAEDQDAKSTTSAHQGSGRHPRVLIVEDHPDTGTLMSMFLSQQGYDVGLAQSFEAAVSELPKRWDAVLCDIGLSDGSGLDVARAAAALKRPPSRMIAVSGFGAPKDIAASRAAGFDVHLVKPVDLHKLLDVLREVPAASGP